jgi:hypothetical protein
MLHMVKKIHALRISGLVFDKLSYVQQSKCKLAKLLLIFCMGTQDNWSTVLIGARVLPGLGRRLYGWKGGRRGWRRGRRRHGAVATGEKEGGGALEAAARV